MNAEAKCPHCGEPLDAPMATEVRAYGMHDNHSFRRYQASSVDDLIKQWRADIEERREDVCLCPVIVMSGKKELRRVGKMQNYKYSTPMSGPYVVDEAALIDFRAALMADPDVSRLMAS